MQNSFAASKVETDLTKKKEIQDEEETNVRAKGKSSVGGMARPPYVSHVAQAESRDAGMRSKGSRVKGCLPFDTLVCITPSLSFLKRHSAILCSSLLLVTDATGAELTLLR